jgi:hypothetical protein
MHVRRRDSAEISTMFFKIILFPKRWPNFSRDGPPKRQYTRSITRRSPGLSWNMELCSPYMSSAHPTHGIKMRISLADSRTNGFKKWSDAQRLAERPVPADIPEPRRHKGESTHPDAGIIGDGI